MNRRQFIKRVTSTLSGLAIFGCPVQHSAPDEMPVTLAIPSNNCGFTGEATIYGIAVGIEKRPIEKRLFVSPFGNDANDGITPDASLLTIQAAIDKAQPDGSVILWGMHDYEVES